MSHLYDVGLQDQARFFLHKFADAIQDFDESHPDAQSAFLARMCAVHADFRLMPADQLLHELQSFFAVE